MTDNIPGEVFIEFTRIGNAVRVTAIDSATGTEVTFQAPANASPNDLKKIAVKKLSYVMKKK